MDGRVEKHYASWLKKKRKIRAYEVQIEQYTIQKYKLQKYRKKKHNKDINYMKIEMNH